MEVSNLEYPNKVTLVKWESDFVLMGSNNFYCWNVSINSNMVGVCVYVCVCVCVCVCASACMGCYNYIYWSLIFMRIYKQEALHDWYTQSRRVHCQTLPNN